MTTSTPEKTLSLELKRSFAVSRERLFDAWTKPELLMKWFGCNQSKPISSEIDLRSGGRYSLTIEHPDGNQFTLNGEIRDVDPPKMLAYTFAWSGDAEMENMPQSLVTVYFDEVEGGSALRLVHSEVAAEEMRASFSQGWNDSLDKLAKALG